MRHLWSLVVLLAVASATVLAKEDWKEYITEEGEKERINSFTAWCTVILLKLATIRVRMQMLKNLFC